MCSALAQADNEEKDAEAGVSTKKTRLHCNTPTWLLPGTITIPRGHSIFVLDCKEIQGGSWKCCRAPSIHAVRAAEPQGCPSNQTPPAPWSAGPTRWHPAGREHIASPQGAPLGPRALLSSEVAFLERWHRLLTNGKLHSKTTLPTGTLLCVALISPSLPGTN